MRFTFEFDELLLKLIVLNKVECYKSECAETFIFDILILIIFLNE